MEFYRFATRNEQIPVMTDGMVRIFLLLLTCLSWWSDSWISSIYTFICVLQKSDDDYVYKKIDQPKPEPEEVDEEEEEEKEEEKGKDEAKAEEAAEANGL